jgi:flagellar biosynthesis component FlhA
MVCGLSGEKPHFELRCHDFVASESVVKKYLDNRNAMQDKLVDEARGWISLAVVSAIAVLVICFVPGIVAHPIVFALLAVLLAVLGVYMFVHSRDKSHAIDVERRSGSLRIANRRLQNTNNPISSRKMTR